MKYILTLLFLVQSSVLFGQISLEVDTSVSSMEITVLGASDSTTVEGDGAIAVTPKMPPFSTAGYTNFQIAAADGVTISLLAGFLTLETQPGDLRLTLVLAGPPGNVVNNEFNQIGNMVQLSGMLDVTDLTGQFGSQTVDLSDSLPSQLDLLDVGIDVVDGELRVGGPFDVTIETGLDLSGMPITVQVTGTIIMAGDFGELLLGDVNQDGSVDILDINPFVNLISEGIYQLEGDIDMNGVVDLLDVAPFVDILISG